MQAEKNQKNLNKLLKNLVFCQLIFVLFINCGNNNESKFDKLSEDEQKALLKKYEYKPTFYYPKSHDKHWRMNQPILEKSEGWIKPNCNGKLQNKDSIRVKIKWQFIEHKRWGKYEGTLVGIDLKTEKEINFDFKCYIPDFQNGDWLNNR